MIAARGASSVADRGYLRLLDELRRSAGPVLVLHDHVVISERPLRLRLDDWGRPHAEDGPAIAYPDGLEAWVWHGVSVPGWVITSPGRITPAVIDEEPNVEVRRVLVERFGAERLIREGGARLVHEDATGRLWERPGPDPRRADDAVVMVEVLNATPEPDGSRKTYYLRVPPGTRTARAAVAWTFGLDADAYAPARET